MLKEIVRYPLWVKGLSAGEFVEVKSPYSGAVVASVAQADEKAIDNIIISGSFCNPVFGSQKSLSR